MRSLVVNFLFFLFSSLVVFSFCTTLFEFLRNYSDSVYYTDIFDFFVILFSFIIFVVITWFFLGFVLEASSFLKVLALYSPTISLSRFLVDIPSLYDIFRVSSLFRMFTRFVVPSLYFPLYRLYLVHGAFDFCPYEDLFHRFNSLLAVGPIRSTLWALHMHVLMGFSDVVYMAANRHDATVAHVWTNVDYYRTLFFYSIFDDSDISYGDLVTRYSSSTPSDSSSLNKSTVSFENQLVGSSSAVPIASGSNSSLSALAPTFSSRSLNNNTTVGTRPTIDDDEYGDLMIGYSPQIDYSIDKV